MKFPLSDSPVWIQTISTGKTGILGKIMGIRKLGIISYHEKGLIVIMNRSGEFVYILTYLFTVFSSCYI
jgi:hypothetical protein